MGRKILRGDLKPGDPLPSEAQLLDEYEVSRTVLREAVKVLAAKGLVEALPKRGTRVRPRQHWSLLDRDVLTWKYEAAPDPGFLRDLIEVRRIIEPRAAALAAERATEADLAEMESAFRQMGASVGKIEEYIVADMNFHDAILAASHNEILEQMTHAIATALRVSRKITTLVPGSSETSQPEHLAVLDALRSRDGAAAEAAMSHLIDRAARDIARALRKADSEAAS